MNAHQIDLTSPDTIADHIKNLIDAHDVVLFMKGTAEQPMCGFSLYVAQVLKTLNVPFTSVNVLSSDALRQGIKTFSDWPTIPQLYVKGEFIGGCDIVREMFDSKELQTLLGVPSSDKQAV